MKQIVTIPALNPEDSLREIVKQNWYMGHQIILVDDGSQESYGSLFQAMSEKCTVLRHKENRGKGAAIKTALRYIKDQLKESGESCVIGIMDADGQHLIGDLKKLLEKAGQHPHALILGSRTLNREMPWKSRWGNQITRKVFQLTTGLRVSDTQTGLRAFSSALLELMLDVPGERYEYEMNVLITCARQNIKVIEVPIQTIYHDKDNSCSHFRKVRDSVRIYRQLLRFSLASFSSFLLDYGLFALFTVFFPHTSDGILAANVGARVISAGYNYTVNCRLIFHEKQTIRTALDYLGLAAVILFLNNILLEAFLNILGLPVYPAKILTECTLFLISWLVQRKLIFRKFPETGTPIETYARDRIYPGRSEQRI